MDNKKEYVLLVSCSNGGRVRDSGEHGRGEFADDGEAIKELSKSTVSLRVCYESVQVTILCGERLVCRKNL